MKRLLAILILPLALLAGCAADDDILSTQNTKIVSYLKSTHVPKLVAEADLAEDGDVSFYSEPAKGVYCYIEGIYDPERPERPEVVSTSTVTITYRAYVFAYSNIVTTGTKVTMPFASNDPLLEDAMSNSGLTPGGWDFEPLVINMSKGGIIKGLYSALLGCREGDYVEAYMTYDKAYGDVYFNAVPLDSPVAWFFTVNVVE